MPVVTICSDFRTEEGEICQYFHLPSPVICHEVMGPDAWSWFFIFSFKLTFSLSFTLIKRLFSSSLLSVIRVVSFAYLRLLMLLSPILIPAYNSSSPAFLMMCLAYRSNRVTADSLVVLLSQSFLLLFLIFFFILFFNFTILYWFCHISTTSSSIQRSICCFLTHIQVFQETGRMAWYSRPILKVSLWEVSTLYYNPHGQRHNQWNIGRCFFGIPYLSLWSSECWEFDL